MKNFYKYFTSESVSEGHPDKIADIISDTILDNILEQDAQSRVACEVMIKSHEIILSGEITTHAKVNFKSIIYNTFKKIGYTNITNNNKYNIKTIFNKQSEELKNTILKKNVLNAGDQGIMFGYASDENKEFMPTAIMIANKLLLKYSEIRKKFQYSWMEPDAKSQVTVVYNKHGYISGIDNIILSLQHNHEKNIKYIKEFAIEEIIKKNIDHRYLKKTKYFINPGGPFTIGGPVSDCGLTGRKIIADTYGGYARHGGGAFSGKDPTKLDRSAAYMLRYIAKNIVASKVCRKCEIQVSYCIGKKNPFSLDINTFNTNIIPKNKIIKIINNNFDLSPNEIINVLKLQYISYENTASYGHFGRNNKNFPWERINIKDMFS